ncbi:MAG TPA: small, acid-soluble spore protein, alpha/beta type [Clostridiales bacterium]|nr:small, acid-soluble spore protein, alpha/beta type [Clostridiales bacterium]
MKKEKKEDRSSVKYEVAQELGLLEKIDRKGWDSLTAKESGKIGGYISKKRFK